ncbi:hypothetical protein BRC89_00665 [Halobacteriales archaeon QS_4_70_19]|nr:MAG: hypothetical protein BRC89_00665 [Halobacteriales archaeon QS_4_70_19]
MNLSRRSFVALVGVAFGGCTGTTGDDTSGGAEPNCESPTEIAPDLSVSNHSNDDRRVQVRITQGETTVLDRSFDTTPGELTTAEVDWPAPSEDSPVRLRASLPTGVADEAVVDRVAELDWNYTAAVEVDGSQALSARVEHVDPATPEGGC